MQATFDPNDIYSALMTLNLKVGTLEQSVSSQGKTITKLSDIIEPIITERKVAMQSKKKWSDRWKSLIMALTIIGAVMGALKMGDEIYLAHHAQIKAFGALK